MESTADLIYPPEDKDHSKNDEPFLPQKYAIQQNAASHEHTQTAYSYFLDDHRDKILHTDDIKFKSQKEFKAYLLNLWNNLNETEKEKYISKAERDQIRFRSVLETKPNGTPIQSLSLQKQ